MQLDDIEILITLAGTKSMSQAADRLYLSRPGLSQRLANIEARYGVKLYERTSKGIEATPAGVIVTKFAREMTQLERALAAELAATNEKFDSTINVGCSLSDGVELLPALVKRFHDSHPEAMVYLRTAYEPQLVEELKAGKLDFAMLENYPIEDGLTRENLGFSQLRFAMPNTAPYNITSQPIKFSAMLKWPQIIYEWNSGRHMVGNRHARERFGVSLNDQYMIGHFGTHEAMFNGVKAGLGWAAFPECIYRRYRHEPKVIWFTVDTDPMLYPVDLVRVQDRAISPLASEFERFIIENVPENYFKLEHPKDDPAAENE